MKMREQDVCPYQVLHLCSLVKVIGPLKVEWLDQADRMWKGMMAPPLYAVLISAGIRALLLCPHVYQAPPQGKQEEC